MTVSDALRFGAEKIGRRDASLFLAYLIGGGVGDVFSRSEEMLPPDKCDLLLSFIARRERAEPLQYIIGVWDFFGLEFFTDPRALIPRPETELLVEAALEFAKKIQSDGVAAPRILDVCTGSGCIALALAHTLGDCAEITAIDISLDALALARENAEKLNLSDRVNFLHSDLLDKIPQSEKFDLIVSNPPYIASSEIPALDPSVRDYEPHLALNGGADGLDLYRRLIAQSKKALHKGGALFLEIGPPAVADLMRDAGDVEVLNDYAGLPRIVRGVLNA
ncbi:MAG: peptide chain release factor N(5)-glutamine methyltransferase [Defluviitaleaceae bacterium]|nr:peptide chain release factor N(5)-glutamine methyltransferase [Defluviitaleaceae bacterium]